eukprot:COSAG02_NODE_32879_length_509_cov_0.626829_1_plen_123_part_10
MRGTLLEFDGHPICGRYMGFDPGYFGTRLEGTLFANVSHNTHAVKWCEMEASLCLEISSSEPEAEPEHREYWVRLEQLDEADTGTSTISYELCVAPTIHPDRVLTRSFLQPNPLARVAQVVL